VGVLPDWRGRQNADGQVEGQWGEVLGTNWGTCVPSHQGGHFPALSRRFRGGGQFLGENRGGPPALFYFDRPPRRGQTRRACAPQRHARGGLHRRSRISRRGRPRACGWLVGAQGRGGALESQTRSLRGRLPVSYYPPTQSAHRWSGSWAAHRRRALLRWDPYRCPPPRALGCCHPEGCRRTAQPTPRRSPRMNPGWWPSSHRACLRHRR